MLGWYKILVIWICIEKSMIFFKNYYIVYNFLFNISVLFVFILYEYLIDFRK